MIKNLTIFFLLTLFCRIGMTASDIEPGADLVLMNGPIYTADPQDRVVQGMAVQAGEIVAVGPMMQIRAWIDEETEVIDLKGAFAMPGFHDVHIHALEAGSTVGGNCWLKTKDDPYAYQKELLQCAKEAEGTEWVLAYGHDIETLFELKEDPAHVLDRWFPDTPVAVMEQSSHSVWVNSTALKVAKITGKTPNPIGGIIYKNKSGQPNGLLLEAAGEKIFNLALQPSKEAYEINRAGLDWAMQELAKNGKLITKG